MNKANRKDSKTNYEKQLCVNTNIDLVNDPLFNSLVISDFISFNKNRKLDFTQPYETYNKILSLVGHFRSGHLNYATKTLCYDYDEIESVYGIKFPTKNMSLHDILTKEKFNFTNVTPHDISKVLSEFKLIDATPNEVFDFSQDMINEVRTWFIDLFTGKKRKKLIDSKGQPLFGINPLADIEFTSDEDYINLTIGFAWAIGVMDTFFPYRGQTDLDIGGGICLPVHRKNMINAPIEVLNDFNTLSNLDIYELYDLPKNTPIDIVEEIFYDRILESLIAERIILKGKHKQSRHVSAGYVRARKGPGTSDFMSIGFGWLTKGMFGALGVLLGDAEDTAQVLASDIYFNGQDEALFKEFMTYDVFREAVEPYLTREWTDALINWSYEGVDNNLNISSCSQSYLSRKVNSNSDTFTTLRKEMKFYENFKTQYNNGKIGKNIPKWQIGFERTPSREFFNYVIKRAHLFCDKKIFPPESWIYENI